MMRWNPFHHHTDAEKAAHEAELAELKKIEQTDEHLAEDLDLLLDSTLHLPKGLIIEQFDSTGEKTMAITGIVKGATGTFGSTPTPAGSVFPAGTTYVWTADDPSVSLTPSSDGTSVAAATSVADTAASFNLTQTSSFTAPGASAPVSRTVNVPLLAPVVPTPTGIAISQIS
jgi:hypothetical protein